MRTWATVRAWRYDTAATSRLLLAAKEMAIPHVMEHVSTVAEPAGNGLLMAVPQTLLGS